MILYLLTCFKAWNDIGSVLKRGIVNTKALVDRQVYE